MPETKAEGYICLAGEWSKSEGPKCNDDFYFEEFIGLLSQHLLLS
jgi:hypothetical protein